MLTQQELRQTEFMNIIPFEHTVEPLLFPSPLSSGIVKGPGHIAEPRGQVNEDDDEDKEPRPSQNQPRQSAPAPPVVLPATAQPHPAGSSAYIPCNQSNPAYRPPVPIPSSSTRTFGAMYGGQQAMDQIAYKEYLPAETGTPFHRILVWSLMSQRGSLIEMDDKRYFGSPVRLCLRHNRRSNRYTR
jgi:chromatin structure-remodeling complex subunit RSC1/2